MFSLIFEELDGEKVMLPVALTAFEECKDDAGNHYTKAYFNGEVWALKLTMNQLQHSIQGAMQAQQPMHLPRDFKVR